ncbi:MAG: InlB B-repeat-containing protein [Bacilli bacterium]|nr:InlB B-repeat-containing protein [Bacilli bacterium]
MRIKKIGVIFLTMVALLTSCGPSGPIDGGDFLVTFKDEDGQTLDSKRWEEGTIPSYTYNKIDTPEWDYTFEGWSLTQNGEVTTIAPVTADITYYAIVDQIKKSYNISFYDENETLLEQISYAYGVQPSYNYAGPSDTDEWDYTFEGWATSAGGETLSVLPTVAGIASYYAVVTSVKQRYTITFESNGGSDVSPIENEYGSSISEPTKPIKDGYRFVAWSYDANGDEEVTWPITLTQDEILYANWNEQVNLKAYFQTLMDVVNHDPYSYIPETMRPTNSANHVSAAQVAYDFNNFTNVNSIKYGGFGEQWHMVLENIEESQRFYSILSLCETAINSSVILFNNYLDSNPSDTASHSLNETEFTASLNFSDGVLSYTFEYKTNLTIPFLGEVRPQIEMAYNIFTFEKSVRIQLTENNAMKYIVKDDSYVFALQYGITAVNRKAYFSIEKSEDESIEGHIYEYVQFQGMDLIPSCVDFYIDNTYTSVVGNKASGMIGFDGYINELYKTDDAKLLGYEIRETFTKWAITSTYHTLWFNLNNISGITSVKAIKNEESTYGLGGNNNHNIYLNGSSSIFQPTYNTKLFVQTSRKYDVELRKQYFYGYSGDQILTYETSIPMMFIQADHDGYTNFSDFSSDILSKSGITSNVTLGSTYLNKIQSDYATLVDIFVENLGIVTGETIGTFIG